MREVCSPAELIAGYFDPAGMTVVDVGCGSGETVRWLASRGARGIGIDRSDVLAAAIAAPRARNESWIAAAGELLPIANGGADVVLYVASLHHLPAARMDEALRECRRVLKEGGRAIVIEPLFRRGSYAEITRMVEDEREVQRLAYAAVLRAATAEFAMAREETFFIPRSFVEYQTLVAAFATDAAQRFEILARARDLTARRAAAAGVPFDAYRWRSTCRANVLVARAVPTWESWKNQPENGESSDRKAGSHLRGRPEHKPTFERAYRGHDRAALGNRKAGGRATGLSMNTC